MHPLQGANTFPSASLHLLASLKGVLAGMTTNFRHSKYRQTWPPICYTCILMKIHVILYTIYFKFMISVPQFLY